MQVKFTFEDTIEWMKSDDYKVRLKAEYWQLVIRMERLRRAIVERYFMDDYIQELRPQFDIMRKYKHILEQRAIAESIDLNNDDVIFW